MIWSKSGLWQFWHKNWSQSLSALEIWEILPRNFVVQRNEILYEILKVPFICAHNSQAKAFCGGLKGCYLLNYIASSWIDFLFQGGFRNMKSELQPCDWRCASNHLENGFPLRCATLWVTQAWNNAALFTSVMAGLHNRIPIFVLFCGRQNAIVSHNFILVGSFYAPLCTSFCAVYLNNGPWHSALAHLWSSRSSSLVVLFSVVSASVSWKPTKPWKTYMIPWSTAKLNAKERFESKIACSTRMPGIQLWIKSTAIPYV